jgi:hypothetical protein
VRSHSEPPRQTRLLRRSFYPMYGPSDSQIEREGTRMRRRALVGLVVATGSLATFLSALPAQAEAAVNCSDFSTQSAAQSYYESVGGPGQDPAGLDADHDGVACESLPCPCRSLSPDTDGDGWVDQYDACPTVSARPARPCTRPRVLQTGGAAASAVPTTRETVPKILPGAARAPRSLSVAIGGAAARPCLGRRSADRCAASAPSAASPSASRTSAVLDPFTLGLGVWIGMFIGPIIFWATDRDARRDRPHEARRYRDEGVLVLGLLGAPVSVCGSRRRVSAHLARYGPVAVPA